jgi:hypothetical protein
MRDTQANLTDAIASGRVGTRPLELELDRLRGALEHEQRAAEAKRRGLDLVRRQLEAAEAELAKPEDLPKLEAEVSDAILAYRVRLDALQVHSEALAAVLARARNLLGNEHPLLLGEFVRWADLHHFEAGLLGFREQLAPERWSIWRDPDEPPVVPGSKAKVADLGGAA